MEAAAGAGAGAGGRFYCATSNVAFGSEAELRAHYRSDFHRYNLKRRAAGLAPVGREWFEAHRKLVGGGGAGGGADRGEREWWVEPLTGKRFTSEQTFRAFTQTKKYKDLVRRNGGRAPEPLRRARGGAPPAATAPRAKGAWAGARGGAASASDGDSSEWETASEDESEEEGDAATDAGRGAAMEEEDGAVLKSHAPSWDPCVSLFDGRVCESIEACLDYMYRAFGFYIPHIEHCQDPEGLLRYLGAKLEQGGIPLYISGLETGVKTFRNLQAVRQHMVDTGKTRLLFEGNEDEYEDWYDFGEGDVPMGTGTGALALASEVGEHATTAAAAGLELALPAGGGDGQRPGRVLGGRDMARYYRQRPRPSEVRGAVLANQVAARYRAIGAAAAFKQRGPTVTEVDQAKYEKYRDKIKDRWMDRNDKIFKLPKNCPY